MKLKNMNIIWLLCILFTYSSCYKEEHFSLPGPFHKDTVPAGFTLPFPFSEDKSAGVYLIKDGVVDYQKIGVRGYTDFAFDIPASTPSWYEGVDFHGDKYFGSRQHKNFYQLSDADNFGGNKFSYECNEIFSRLFLKTGAGRNWYFYAKMTLTSLGHNSLCHFIFEGNTGYANRSVAGFDDVWAQPEVFFYRNGGRVEPIVANSTYKHNFEQMTPGEPFEYELVCINGLVYCKIGGLIIWMNNMNPEAHARPIDFRPLTNAVRFYDIYVEGDYDLMNMVSYQQEEVPALSSASAPYRYVTVQAPALTKAGNDILLFAEGRKENMVQTADLSALRSNATDIIMKRSSDGGDTWTEARVLVGGDGTVNMRPSVVTSEDGTIHLFYTTDRNGKQNGDYQVYHCTSTDQGQSWSAPVAIDCSVPGYYVSTTAGHGIMTSKGAMIVPLQLTLGSSGTLATLCSTDKGQTWQLGEKIDGLRNRYANLWENDGVLMMYIGHNGAGKSRKVCSSEDNGMTWTVPVESTINTGNFGHQSSGATVRMADGRLVHFTANNFVKANNYALGYIPGNRNDFVKQQKEMYLYNTPDMLEGLTVVVSEDQGGEWSAPESVLDIETYKDYKFFTGNMDAISVDGNMVLCICEGGTTVPYEGLICFKKAL